jgi:branched-chain amino acid transport system substrate-binding protein
MLRERKVFSTLGTAFAALALTAAGAAYAAPEPVNLNVILPLTGGASFVGQSSEQAIKLEQEVINRHGGINGRPVHFIFHDDQTSPQVAVQLVNQLSKVNVILGSEITAMCNAMAPLLSKGPFVYCLSPGIHPKPGSNMFGVMVPISDMAPQVLTFFRAKGWTRVALMASTDASGQDGFDAFIKAFKLPENKGMTIVKEAHFNPTALNVSAQMTDISAAKPQAIIAWTTGAPAGTVLKGYAQAGLTMPLVIGQGNIAPEFMKLYSAVLPMALYLPGGLGVVRADNIKVDPRMKAPREVYLAALDKDKLVPQNGYEVVWDPIMLTVQALRKLGPDATSKQIHDYLSAVQGYAGISGVYDFKKYPNRGLGGARDVITHWDANKGEFVAVSEIGGKPIAQK